MNALQSAIELYDGFSGPLNNIINALNNTVAAFTDMQRASAAPIDTSSLDSAVADIDQTTLAVQELENQLSSMTAQPQFDFPDKFTVPVEAVVTQQPHIEVPDGLTVPVEPVVIDQPEITVPVTAEVTQQPEINVPDGLSVPVDVEIGNDPQQQLDSITNELSGIVEMQNAIRNIADSVYILPDDVAKDISGVNREISRIEQAINFLNQNPFDLNTSIAQLQIESIQDSLDSLIEKQSKIDGFMENVPSKTLEVNVEPNFPDLPNQEPVQVPVQWQTDTMPTVQVPVEWQTDSLEVFTSTGIERFEQEVNSANALLGNLNAAQERINQQAASMDILPPDAISDLNTMQSRIQAIQQRIQQIENNPVNMGTDEANAQLETLRGQLAQAISAQESLNKAVADMNVEDANAAYLELSNTVSNTERYIRDNTDEQGRFNASIDQGTDNANNLFNLIKGAVAAYASMQTIQKAMDLSDQLTSTTARLNMMNDGLQSTEDLQNMIYLSAERSRGAYQQTADAVSKFGLMAGDAFSSSAEIIAFAEQLNKRFVIAGTEASGIDAAMLQLTQAMGSGVLRGEEFNSIMEQAPNIIQAIADYMEVPKGQLKDMAAEGQITAEIVKNAMFATAEETNAQFESMPKTFSQIWTSFENSALMAFQPVLQQMNEIANSEGFEAMVNGAINAVASFASIALNAFELMASGAEFVADNWSWISPIIYGVVAAMGLYVGYLTVMKAAEIASTATTIAMCIASYAHAAATGTEVSALTAATAAQYGLNTALLASPITWIIVGIIAVIAAIYAVVGAIDHLTGSSVSATGIIGGLFASLGAFIINTFVVPTWNMFAAIANFFGNVFNNPVAAVEVLFYDMCLTVLGYISNLAHAIENLLNKIPGVTVDITSGLDNFYNGLEQAQQAVKDQSGWVDYVQKMDYIDYGDAWDKGYSFGEGIDDSIANFDPASLFGANTLPTESDYPNTFNTMGATDLANDVSDIAGNTGSMADSLSVSQDELKYMRDIAEQETINRFTTADININMGGVNNYDNATDLDGFVDAVITGVNEAVEVGAEGVHK